MDFYVVACVYGIVIIMAFSACFYRFSCGVFTMCFAVWSSRIISTPNALSVPLK